MVSHSNTQLHNSLAKLLTVFTFAINHTPDKTGPKKQICAIMLKQELYISGKTRQITYYTMCHGHKILIKLGNVII